MLAGVTLVANGIKLKYSFVLCIENLLKCCDNVYVSADVNNKDDTTKVIRDRFCGKVNLIETEWDWGITNGTDLAYRANLCIEKALQDKNDMVLYVQADEIADFYEVNKLKNYKIWGKTNFSLERTYFWKDLYHINRSWTHNLVRLGVLNQKVKVTSDGMYMDIDSNFNTLIVPNSVCRIYHYSRVGSTQCIASRLNNLDLLFHEKNEFTPLDDYNFGINNNFESGVATAIIEEYQGEHPDGAEEFFDE